MLKLILFPLSWVYRFIVASRNFLYEAKILKQHEFEVPIISVGNITVGGTGKTPLAEYLVELLNPQFKVAYLSRGYKRKTKGFMLANSTSGVFEIGDEAAQIKLKFPDLTVAVCENRVKGINNLLSNKALEIDLVILDDAFQHRRVKPGINILLIDYTRPLSTDRLLPSGRLREPASAHLRSNLIVFTKCPSQLPPIEQRIIKNNLKLRPYQNLFFTSIVYGEITPAIQGRSLFFDDLKKYKVLLITGIAHPTPLLDHLENSVGTVTHVAFSDHYNFTYKDISQLADTFYQIDSKNKMIITTEKDLSRIRSIPDLPEPFSNNLYYIPIQIRFLDHTKELFNRKIKNYVTENKSNSRLHKK